MQFFKVVYFLLLLFCSAGVLTAQEKIKIRKQKEVQNEIVVGPFRDTLFIGIDNYVQIKNPQVKNSKEIVLSAVGGGVTLSPTKLNSVYKVRVMQKAPVKITINYKGKEILNKIYTVLYLPSDKKFLDRTIQLQDNDPVLKQINEAK
jgi:hypothetical protein